MLYRLHLHGRRDMAIRQSIDRVGGRCRGQRPRDFEVDIEAESAEGALSTVREAVAGFAVEVSENAHRVRA